MSGNTEEIFKEFHDKLKAHTGDGVLNVEISEQGWRALMIENKHLLFGITDPQDMPTAYAFDGMVIHREKKRD